MSMRNYLAFVLPLVFSCLPAALVKADEKPKGHFELAVAPVEPGNYTYSYLAISDAAKPLATAIKGTSKDNRTIEFATGNTNFPLVEPTTNKFENALIGTVFEAYNRHLTLELTPDDFWVLIAQGVASYLGNPEVAEKLRKQFVEHEGKKTLTIKIPGSAANDEGTNVRQEAWPPIVDKFAEKINENTHTNISSIITKAFSTSGRVEGVVRSGTLMATMKNYFKYRVVFMCGIPKIILHGEESDYVDILARVEELGKIFPDLEWWFTKVEKHMTKILQTIQRQIDGDWWRRMIFEEQEGSGGGQKRLSGWIGDFIPFAGGALGNRIVKNRRLPLDDLPHGISVADVELAFQDGRTKQLKLATGFFGTYQNPDTLSLRPVQGWIIFELK